LFIIFLSLKPVPLSVGIPHRLSFVNFMVAEVMVAPVGILAIENFINILDPKSDNHP
jgi:hypothetical protein